MIFLPQNTMTKEQVIELLKKRMGKRTQREFAAQIGVREQYLSDVLNGRRDPGPTILAHLELEKAFSPKE